MTVTLIAARARNNVIGLGNTIPWRADGEQKLFKEITMGGVLVMGRKTFDSIGRPLPGRKTIVITRNPAWRVEGCETARSLDDALNLAVPFDQPVFIAGGGEIYRQSIDRVGGIHLTTIDVEPEGDVFFPEIPDGFEVTLERAYSTNVTYTYQFLTKP